MANRKYNYKTKIVAAIRRIWFYGPERKEAMKRAKEGNFYRCERCRGLFEKVQVDHIIPAVLPETGWTGFDAFVENLTCDASQLQCICETCHKKKSSIEKDLRKDFRKKRKEQENENK